MLPERTIATLLSQPIFVGLMLRGAIHLEHQLDQTLALYFLRSSRIDLGLDVLLPALMVSRKIDLLARLPIPKRLKSRKAALAGLRRFNELRNLIAHNYIVRTERVRVLMKDPAKRAMFAGLPGIEGDEKATSRALWRLCRTAAFGLDSKRRADEVLSRDLILFMTHTDSAVKPAIEQLLRRHS